MIASELFFDKIQQQYNNQLPFVAYRKPQSLDLKGIFQTNDTVYKVKNYKESGFVFAPFDDSESSILIPLEHADSIDSFYSIEEGFHPGQNEFTFKELEKELHIKLIAKGINFIGKNIFEKVVLSRKETVTVSGSNFIQFFKNLLNYYASAFVYCWYHPKVGLWLGATPETLMKIEGHQFSMMSLAGTQEYKGTLNVDWEDKEKQEQQIVTDFITSNLKPLVKNIKISDVETVKAGNLVHLKTMIKASLNVDGFNLKHILSVIHPTPAVCGMPKQTAKRFIIENENYNREFYSGYLGELNFEQKSGPSSKLKNIENQAYTYSKRSTQLYVNLRCMQIKNNEAYIYIGGGITKTSNPEKEWEETVSKSKVIKNIL